MIHSIWTIRLVFSGEAASGAVVVVGGKLMQQHACERQDGQATLGSQSIQETMLDWAIRALKETATRLGKLHRK